MCAVSSPSFVAMMWAPSSSESPNLISKCPTCFRIASHIAPWVTRYMHQLSVRTTMSALHTASISSWVKRESGCHEFPMPNTGLPHVTIDSQVCVPHTSSHASSKLPCASSSSGHGSSDMVVAPLSREQKCSSDVHQANAQCVAADADHGLRDGPPW